MAVESSRCLDERTDMRPVLVLAVLGAISPSFASSDGEPLPRWIARFDLGMLAGVTGGAKGGGITVPTGGTGTGLESGAGVEVGLEARVFRWIALGVSVAWYRPTLAAYRDPGPDTFVDGREETIDLRTLTFEVVVTPPKLRFEAGRLAFGVLLVHPSIPEVPSALGLSIDSGSTGLGVDVRGDWFLAKNRRWGVGGALAFVNLDPQFVDLETGEQGSVQTGLLRLRLGVRGTW
jgi:hypothetical protein